MKDKERISLLFSLILILPALSLLWAIIPPAVQAEETAIDVRAMEKAIINAQLVLQEEKSSPEAVTTTCPGADF